MIRCSAGGWNCHVIYPPCLENIPPDVLLRSYCGVTNSDGQTLYTLDDALCHPCVTRMYHFVRSKNLPYSMKEVRQVIRSCKIYAECIPRLHKSTKTPLVKATRPFERLNFDFKGPLLSTNRNRYFLNIVDEYSRFPLVFPCINVTSQTVITCLSQLFSIFGIPAYIHTDLETSCMSSE